MVASDCLAGAGDARDHLAITRREAGLGLPAAETWFAFFGEGSSGFAVILGEPGVRMMGHFQIHALTQLAGYGPVQVLLHVAVSDRRPLRQPACPFHYLPLEV
jgi:hypothetical protein